jgi:indolepyruvate ferredoxin oxidoreductase
MTTELKKLIETAWEDRNLINFKEYKDAINELLVSLNSKNHALAVKMANLPEQIKGFGHVKERNLAAVMVQWQSCMDDFRKTN